MCTAISVKCGDHYFGRNLDYHCDFGEKVVITPRNYRFNFTNGHTCDTHYAIIGVALEYSNYPLYFDATNEKGLSVAGLNFPGFSQYNERINGKENVASYEIIPWILLQCETVSDAVKYIERVNITNDAFDSKMTPTPLHWIIADGEKTVTIEQTNKGIEVYENPVGVLTNSPPFDMQMINLCNYMMLSSDKAINSFADKISLIPYGKGLGAFGLPGDCSPMSRFVRASFQKLNCEYGKTENEIVNNFFHILNSVYHISGSVRESEGFQITNYSSCCNTSKGIYYYTTYYNSSINAVDIRRENLNSDKLITYDFIKKDSINIQN